MARMGADGVGMAVRRKEEVSARSCRGMEVIKLTLDIYEENVKARVIRVVLVLSMAANVVLVWLLPGKPLSVEEVAQFEMGRGEIAESNAKRVEAGENSAGLNWTELSSGDFYTLRKGLLEAGCPETLVAVILETAIDRAYRPGMVQAFGASRKNFWELAAIVKTKKELPPDPVREEAKREFSRLNDERNALLRQLVDPEWGKYNPRRFGDEPDARLNFLSDEKRRILEEQQRAVVDLRLKLRDEGVRGREEQEQVDLLQKAQAEERGRLLTAEELEEYRLRFSRQAHVVQNLYGFEPTAEERKRIIGLYEAHEGKPPEGELEKVLGAERMEKFRRAGDSDFAAIYKVGSYLGRGEEEMERVLDLKQAAETAAKEISARKDLGKRQRQAALRGLKEQVTRGIEAEFGREGSELYLRNGGGWIGYLAGEGE